MVTQEAALQIPKLSKFSSSLEGKNKWMESDFF